MSMRCLFIVTLPGLLVASLVAQGDADRWLAQCRRDWGDRPKACLVRESGFRPSGGVLTIHPSENGGVAVFGWDRDSVAVIAKIEAFARSEAAAEQLAESIRIAAAGREIRATGPDTHWRESWAVSFDVYVPRHTDLALETTNGPLSVEDVTGSMQLRAQNGPINLSAVGGDVRVRVQNGPLTVELAGSRWEGPGLDAVAQN